MDEFEWEHPETNEVWRVSTEGEAAFGHEVYEDGPDDDPEILVVFKGRSEIRTVRWFAGEPLERLDDDELLDLFQRSRPH